MEIPVYVLSYFGEGRIRDKRVEIHRKQINWLLGLPLPLKIFVFAQFYSPGEYIEHERVEYIPSPTPDILIPVNVARNVYLPIFFQSDYPFALFADNDSIIDVRTEPDFIRLINKFEFIKGVDMTYPIDPGKTPIKDTLEMLKTSPHFIFQRDLGFRSSIYIMRNIKDLELQYSPDIVEGDDDNFGLELVSRGYTLYKCLNLIHKDWGHSYCTIEGLGDSRKQGREWTIRYKTEIAKRWEGVEIENGKYNRRAFMRKHFYPPRLLFYKTTGERDMEGRLF